MKKILIISILAILTLITGIATAQNYPDEYLGLPGDNLNLYATMKLFQESETLESFEKNLNDENSRINNLDLNRDNQVDYIMVIDYVDGDVHSIVMRAALNSNETQDVAVFTVQRFNDGTVEIQLVGDEALYGPNYIVEPIFANTESETPNPGYTANNRNIAVVRTTTYEIAAWPVVRYIYLPNYVTWHSSWHWGYYPHYWNPWRPFYWHTYYGYHYNMHNHYYSHYRMWNHHRCRNYNNFYYSNIRTYSHNVRTRIDKGHYKNTYSRPDLRRNGDVLYSRRTNSGTRTTASADIRRINSKSSTTRTTERASATNTSRRAASSVNRGNENSRKSATVSNTRTVKSSSVGQNRGNTHRSSANVSSRNVTRTPAANRSSVSSRNSSGQSKTKSAAISRSSGNQSRKAVSTRSSGSSSRSSGSVSKSARSSNRSSGSVSRSSGSSNRSSGSVSRSSGSSNRSSGAKSSQSRTSSSGRSGRR